MKNNCIFMDKGASCFEEAFPLGNGSFGAMVYGDVNREFIHFNKDTLWSGMPENGKVSDMTEYVKDIRKLVFDGNYLDAQRLYNETFHFSKSQCYLPLGELYIDSLTETGLAAEYKRCLDMENGVIDIAYKRETNAVYGAQYFRQMYISSEYDVMIIKYNCEVVKHSLSVWFESLLKYDTYGDENVIYIDGKAMSDSNIVGYDKLNGDDAMRFHFQARVITLNGIKSRVGNKVYVSNADEVILVVTAETDFVDFETVPDKNINLRERCGQKIQRALDDGLDKVFEVHCRNFSEKFGRVSFDLYSDEEERELIGLVRDVKNGVESVRLAELMFNYGRYLMISSSSQNSRAMNLQGIWNEHLIAPWNCNYTTNINIEMNYWPAEVCNLSECHMPMMKMIEELCRAGKETAKRIYGCRGSVAHHNVDLWCKTTPSPGNPHWALWPMALGWMARHLWEHYIYNNDEEFLKSTAYPLTEIIVSFYADYLVEHNGYYVTCPSTSAENDFLINGERCAIAYASTMDMAILKDLFSNYLKMTKLLNIKNDLIKKVGKIIEKLYPYHINSDGRLAEWCYEFEEADKGHRHFSHLYGLYPGNTLSEETPELFEAAAKSIECRVDNGSGHTGWSCAWLINLYARLQDGENAYKFVRKFLSNSIYSNLFDSHPPFQIDGNFGFTSGICEMLVQSRITDNGETEINILPAIPKKWKSGRVIGLKARGNIFVDIEWQDKTAFVKIKACGRKHTVKALKFDLKITYTD